VWEDHLLPRLTSKDAMGLGRTCKALRVVVREHFRDIGLIGLQELRAALTMFLRARSVRLYLGRTSRKEGAQGTRGEALVQWLREGGCGAGLTTIDVTGDHDDKDVIHGIVHAALRAGALPSLKTVAANLKHEAHRAMLTGGLLGGMHELTLMVALSHESAPQLAGLGLVRQLPALSRLELRVCLGDDLDDPVEWPPFIPPSLKALLIDTDIDLLCDCLLRALPGMITASGATLERLELPLSSMYEDVGDGLVHVAQAVRCCWATLKDLRIPTGSGTLGFEDPEGDHDTELLERLNVQWAEVLAGVSACRELQVLKLPSIEVEPLFPPGTAFPRLTHLEISDHAREHPPGDAGGVGLWELMASGGLPALAKLKVKAEGWVGRSAEVRTRVAPAFEAVAGTLTHLHLDYLCIGGRLSESDAGYDWGLEYEWGGAVGKLRRLRSLTLRVGDDGRAYHAFARGLAASGGHRPLPLLWGSGWAPFWRTMPTWWQACSSPLCGSSARRSSAAAGRPS
jgi:hypothetical protein